MDDKLTLIDAVFGLCVTVTPVSKGYAVTFIDSDADAIIATRLYDDRAKAYAYAHGLINRNPPAVVNL